jgi:hypothetical protein
MLRGILGIFGPRVRDRLAGSADIMK